MTAAEESQRSTAIVTAPCKVLSDLPVPRAFHFSAARVGGRLFMYGGTVPRPHLSNVYSTALHILHIASRHVEVHEASLVSDGHPVMLTNHASCAVGRNVFLFGGLRTHQLPNSKHPEPFSGNLSVWELDTSATSLLFDATLLLFSVPTSVHSCSQLRRHAQVARRRFSSGLASALHCHAP